MIDFDHGLDYGRRRHSLLRAEVMRARSRRNLPGPPPLQRQQVARALSASPRCPDFDKPRNAACSTASAVSFDFPGMSGPHSPHPRKTVRPSPNLMHSEGSN